MCPLLSCCHGRGTSFLRNQFNYLVRLLLASGTPEVSPAQQVRLEARLNTLWDRLHYAVQHHYRVSTARARDLAEHLLQTILREDCCCRSLQQAVPLSEALGVSAPAPGNRLPLPSGRQRPLARPTLPARRAY